MRTEVIKADTIDVAVERILSELRADTRRSNNRENVIYFDGWNGLGASAVLQAVVKRLTISIAQSDPSMRPVGLDFEKIMHIDCSKWESRRAMQREIAEQLKLPNWVMEMFDKQDEEDDFDGLDQGSRGEIEQVFPEIYQTVQNCRWLVILHNGSNDEIDISSFGLYLSGYANSKMLWTFRGRFRLDPKVIDNLKKSTTTHVLLSASRDGRDPKELWSYLVRHEAAQVSWNKHGHTIIDSAIAAECVSYMLKQSWIASHIIDYNWDIHAGNYWLCDGIITHTDIDQAWQVSNALQHEVQLLLDMYSRLNIDESGFMTISSQLASSGELMPYWISASTCGFVLSPSGAILDNLFQHSHRLGVLKISRCAFSFSSPPFLCCQSLRFLCLEHCQDLLIRSTKDHHRQKDADEEEEEEEPKELENNTTSLWECFQSLWVLDLRFTDWDEILSTRVIDLMTQLRELNMMGAKNWDMSNLQGRLRNIRKLRVTKSTCYINNDVLSDMERIELLDFSGNTIRQGMRSLSGPASNNSLKTVIIDGCDGLKIISFRNCKELKNMFLKGSLGSLEELDLAGTKVKTLDLGGVQSTLPKRIILLGCENLRAILWPGKRWPEVLQIDTTSTSASAGGGEAPHVHPNVDRSLQKQKEENFKGGWQIYLTDARLLRSLSPVVRRYSEETYLHIDIYSPAILGGRNVQGTYNNKQVQVQPHTSTMMDSECGDVLKDSPVEVIKMWECPHIPVWLIDGRRCIIEVVMDGQANKLLKDATGDLLFPDFVCEEATSLHVYDNPSITSIPAPPKGSRWRRLWWSRVERCPKIHTVFAPHQGRYTSFDSLQTFWASQLLSARYIWDTPYGYFDALRFLHLEYCPRLVHVLPLSTQQAETERVLYLDQHQTLAQVLPRDSRFFSLETLEIVYCGDLMEVFKLQEQDKVIIEFPNLSRIHLHELPTLQYICRLRMRAPMLETIKIRGCWSLRRLPAVGRDTKPPEVDCEKEWWDNLEWDGLEEHHHPSLYKPSYSLY